MDASGHHEYRCIPRNRTDLHKYNCTILHVRKRRKAGNLVVKERCLRLKYKEDELIKQFTAQSYLRMFNFEAILKKTNVSKTKGTCFTVKGQVLP